MTNWQLIITLATLVLAIFGANGLFYLLANKRIDDLKGYLDARLDTLRVEITGLRAEMNARFSSLDERVGRIERQLEAIFKPVLPGRGD